jgi:hypothetical protein
MLAASLACTSHATHRFERSQLTQQMGMRTFRLKLQDPTREPHVMLVAWEACDDSSEPLTSSFSAREFPALTYSRQLCLGGQVRAQHADIAGVGPHVRHPRGRRVRPVSALSHCRL